MKKTSLFLALSAALLLTTTGCLKDKGFENHEYGTVVSGTNAVAFTQAAKSPVVVGITGQAAPLTIAGPLITVESASPATSDITVKLENNNAAVTAAGLTPLPAGSFTVSNMNPVIKKDSSYINNLTITINNSNTLDPNKTYGVGFKIASVDQGYQIASNSSTVVIGITIKNKYDGIYSLKGHHNRSPYTFPYLTDIHLITSGPNGVYFYWPEVKSIGHPIGVGPDPVNDLSWYGDGIAPEIVFNPANDLVTNVFNKTPGTPIDIYAGAGSGQGRFVASDPSNGGKKTIYVYWRYNANDLRAFMDTLTYIGPRP